MVTGMLCGWGGCSKEFQRVSWSRMRGAVRCGDGERMGRRVSPGVCAIPWRWSGQVEIRGDRRSKSRFCRCCDQERECHCVVDLLSLIGTPPHSGLSGHEVDGLLQQHFSLCVSHFPWLNWPYWLFECDSIWWVWTNIARSFFFTSSSTVAGQMWQKLFW